MSKGKRNKKLKLENLKIEIKHNERTPLSYDQANNYLDSEDYIKKQQKRIDAIKDDKSIHTMDEKAKAKYLLYCIDFLDTPGEKAFLLGLMAYSRAKVAKDFFGAVTDDTLVLVDKREKDLMKKCMDKINTARHRDIPIIGEN